MNTKWYLTLLPLLFGCGHSPADLYRESEALWHRGAVSQAIEVADRGWRQWKSQPTAEWHWRFRLLEAELLLNENSPVRALELLQSSSNPPPSDELNARYLADLGFAKRNRVLVNQAFELASRQGQTLLLPAIELKRASLDRYSLRSDQYLRNAVALARAQSDTYMEAWALLDLGFQRLNMSRYDEAIAWLDQAESTAQRARADRLRERSLGNLGWCYFRLGDFDRALSSLSTAVTLAREVKDGNVDRWLNDIGNIYYRRHDYGQAIIYYQGAADLANKANDQAWLALTLNNLAATYLEIGDVASAERVNIRAAELATKARYNSSLLHSRLHTARIKAALNQPAEAEASFREAIATAEQRHDQLVLWEAHAGLARQLHANGSDAEADEEYRSALVPIEQEWSKLGEDRHKVTFLSQLISFYTDYIDFLTGRGEIDRAAALADSSRARVLAEKLGREPTAVPAALRPWKSGQILLSYWLTPAHSYLWLMGPQGIAQFKLPGADRIARLVTQYAADVEAGHDPLSRDNPAGRALYDTLIAPAAALIPSGSNVIVIPDGALHGLNFETLITPNPAPHYWIEDVTVSIAPALGLLQSPATRRAGHARMLFLGDPAPADPAFPPLPHLKQEAEIVQRSYPGGAGAILTRTRASPQAYREANPSGFSHIHFAAHAVANAESPLNSAIILSKSGEDYKLYAKDVIDQPLQADLVTISGCHGAGAKAYAGEGLVGFTWAFLQAGARNVIAGLWDADDAATVEIMAEFYKRLGSGSTPAEALRLAKMKLLRSKEPNRRPYYWGTLQLFTREMTGRANRSNP